MFAVCMTFSESFIVATNVPHPAGPPGLGFLHSPVPEATYKITTLRLNIYYILFGLLA